MARVVADTTELEQFAKDIVRAKGVMLGRLAERGRTLLVDEIPYQTGNLKQGVSVPDVDYVKLRAELNVTARSARSGATTAQVFDSKGKAVKTVSLRPTPAYNYAAAVAQGRPSIRPRHGKALLIPVPSAPRGEGYLLINGQAYVVRRSAKATKPNPFDERAARRLEKEAPDIGRKVLEQFV